MNGLTEIEQGDLTKLHAESLQLRNQQFLLGTVALTGSGLSAWITPGIVALTEKQVPELALVGGTLIWLVLLGVLFEWSLALRRLISVVSRYLEARGYSKWEAHFRLFPTMLAPSQSGFVAGAFGIYGCIAFTSAILAHTAVPERVALSSAGRAVLELALIAYLFLVVVRTMRREKGTEILKAWRGVLKDGDVPPPSGPATHPPIDGPAGDSGFDRPK